MHHSFKYTLGQTIIIETIVDNNRLDTGSIILDQEGGMSR